MAASLIRTIFRDHWQTAKEQYSAVYSEYTWESIVEAVEKMLGCGDPAKGYAEYICPRCHKKKKVPFT